MHKTQSPLFNGRLALCATKTCGLVSSGLGHHPLRALGSP